MLWLRQTMKLDDLVPMLNMGTPKVIRNNAGGIYNHLIYFKVILPSTKSENNTCSTVICDLVFLPVPPTLRLVPDLSWHALSKSACMACQSAMCCANALNKLLVFFLLLWDTVVRPLSRCLMSKLLVAEPLLVMCTDPDDAHHDDQLHQ